MNAPPGGQRVVGRLDEVHLPLQVPVVQDHAHRDDVGLGQRILEEVARRRRDAIAQARRRRCLRSAIGVDGRQVERCAVQVRVPLGDDDREQPGGAADVAQGLVVREVELLGESLEVAARDAASSRP